MRCPWAALACLRLSLAPRARAFQTGPPAPPELVRIPLWHHDELDVYGRVRVGSAVLDVVFDTGSSESWLSASPASGGGSPCLSGAQGGGRTIHYGGGSATWRAARRTAMHLAASAPHGELAVPPLCVGVVDQDAAVLAEIRADGVLGLGMEALQQLWGPAASCVAGSCSSSSSSPARRPPLLLELLAEGCTAVSRAAGRPFAFSIFIDEYPRSQLVLGGADPRLAAPNATWRSFPVVPDAPGGGLGFGFWALRLGGVSVGGQPVLPGRDGRAVLDSGSSLILLPPPAFRVAADTLAQRLGGRFACSQRDHAAFQSLECGCRRCAALEFPDLVFSLAADAGEEHALVLRGPDYVRCRHGACSLLLDADASGGRVVLGAVFLRAFYTTFDYSNKHVTLARSGRHGRSSSSGGSSSSPVPAWRSVAAALAVIAWSVLCLSLAAAWIDKTRDATA